MQTLKSLGMYLELLNSIRAKAVIHITQQPINQIAGIPWQRNLHNKLNCAIAILSRCCVTTTLVH